MSRAETRRLLEKWIGGRVKFWRYTASFSQLTLRLESQMVGGNLHIVCGSCLHVQGPFGWENAHLRLIPGRDETAGAVEVLRDEDAGFELRRHVVSAVENFEPVYFVDRLATFTPTWVHPASSKASASTGRSANERFSRIDLAKAITRGAPRRFLPTAGPLWTTKTNAGSRSCFWAGGDSR